MRETIKKQVALEHHMEYNWGRPDLVRFAKVAIDLVNDGKKDEYIRIQDGNVTLVYFNENGAVTAEEFCIHFRLDFFLESEE